MQEEVYSIKMKTEKNYIVTEEGLKKSLRGSKIRMGFGMSFIALTAYISIQYLSILSIISSILGGAGGALIINGSCQKYKEMKGVMNVLTSQKEQSKLEELATE